MINPDHKDYSIKEQCELLSISRNAYYYEPKVSEFRLTLMRRIDELYTANPAAGQRSLQSSLLRRFGIKAGRKLIRHMMDIMQIASLAPKPFLSAPNTQHKKYPYLLRGVVINRVNQVWSTDITYIKLRNGFAYLTAVIDWYSRRILSWRLSTTLSTDFCEECTREAIEKYGWPDEFNTDQGCQFTSEQFTNIFNGESCSTRLSMDGKGRAFDNIFVKRFWRTLKYEDVYLKGYETVVECRKGLGEYICKYNDIREHSSVDGNTPSDIYFGRVKLERAA